jgi:hypothetical protein
MWWIRAAIQEYILRSWSLAKMGTTANQKKLFFKLRKAKSHVSALDESDMRPDRVKLHSSLHPQCHVRFEPRRYKVEECTHFDRQKAVGRVDEADRCCRRLEIIQQGCQCPSIERCFDVGRGSNRDTDAGACSIAGRFDAADDEPGMDRDGQFGLAAYKRPDLRSEVSRIADTVVASEFVGCQRCSARR